MSILKDLTLTLMGEEKQIKFFDMFPTFFANDNYNGVIPQNSNLDTYKVAGQYTVKTGAIAKTLSNCPSNDGGRLIVMQTVSSSYVVQIYVVVGVNSVTNIYVRGYENGKDFSPWHKLWFADEATHIVEEPHNYTGAEDSTVSMSVNVAFGGTLSYQWYLSKNGGSSWASLGTSYQKESFTFALTSARNGYMYRCVVTGSKINSDGTTTVLWSETSQPATVRIG